MSNPNRKLLRPYQTLTEAVEEHFDYFTPIDKGYEDLVNALNILMGLDEDIEIRNVDGLMMISGQEDTICLDPDSKEWYRRGIK
jgi:hypothetical protein